MIDLDLALVDVDAGFPFELLGDVAVGDRSEEAAALACLGVDSHGQLAQPLRHVAGVAELLLLTSARGLLTLANLLDDAIISDNRQVLGEQKVARVTRGHLLDVPSLCCSSHFFQKQHSHEAAPAAT